MTSYSNLHFRDGENTRHRLWLRTIKFINAILITIPFAMCWYQYYAERIRSPYYSKGNILVVVLFLILYIIFGRIYSGFTISLYRISELVYSQFLAIIFTNAIMYIVMWLLTKHLPNIVPMLISIGVEVALSVIWSWSAHKIYFKINEPIDTVILWDARKGLEDLINSYGLNIRFNIVNTINVWDIFKDPDMYLKDIGAVFLIGVHSHERNKVIKYCISRGIRVYLIPRVGDLLMESAHPIHLFHLPMLMLERYNPTPEFLFVKRLFDIVSSGLALIILSPLMLVIAFLIRRDGGTAFYKQKRLTRNGKEFYVLKFRSMRMDAEKDGIARLSTGENDDRITPIGHFIRACRIDELPQLINILKGEMSVVGPRPERPEIAIQYEEQLPEFSLRLQAKAGLTGYAQVYGKYNTTPRDKLLMDLQYIANPSIVEDMKIIFATIKILFLPDSTEGVQTGQTTAMGPASEKADSDLVKDA